MEMPGYLLERLREDSEFVLYRGNQSGAASSVLLLGPASRKATPAGFERLQHELELSPKLTIAFAAKPMAIVRHEGCPMLLLDDPGGQLLDGLLGKPLEVPYFLKIAIGLAAAVGEVHESGLIHKDIKPKNVFVDAVGNVRLTGFGFATSLPRERQGYVPPESIPGTLAYMAPEQTGRMNRSIDKRSDLYALGVTFYEMLVGALPFAATNPAELLYCQMARQAPPPSLRVEGIPAVLESIILKLLSKNAEERYQTATGIEHDLRRCVRGLLGDGRIEPFRLAERDVPGQLQIPEKLYGRESAVSALTENFQHVATTGEFRLLLVSGESGTGKSSLVSELRPVLYSGGGLFAAGKFDQFKRDIPYATLAEAFQGLVRQILGQNDEELARWRILLTQVLGTNGQLIVDLIPELGLIIGPQPSLAAVPPQDAKSRFQPLFRSFIGVFARHDHPLVLFLDDLQWLDAATLDLLERLATVEEIPHLLLIGAYRDTEVGALHPLGQMLGRIEEGKKPLNVICLAPLQSQAITQLVAGALKAEEVYVSPLAQMVYLKTLGNPFFAIQFLTTLNSEGLLHFNKHAGAWRWDIRKIRAKQITDNVALLMAAKLGLYEKDSLRVLKQLACLGNCASIGTLSHVLTMTEPEVESAFRPFVDAGLLHRSEQGYVFSHDRVQEAAYGHVAEPERAPLHLRIGQLLTEGIGEKSLHDAIFDIAIHFNRGAPAIKALEDRLKCTEVNLIAGKKAKAATAYESALTYLAAAAASLPADSWGEHYRLNFEIEFHRADCQFMVGDIELANMALANLSRRSASLLDLSVVVGRQVILYTYLGRIDRAFELSSDALAKLGVSLPMYPSHDNVEAEYQILRDRIGVQSIESVVDLPVMTDAHWRAVIELLEGLLGPTGVLNLNLFLLTVLRMVNISLTYGNSDESAHAYATLGGMVLGRRFGSYADAQSFGRVAMRLVDERGLDRYASRVYSVFSGLIAPYGMPMKECVAVSARATDAGPERGGLTYSGYAWATTVGLLLDSGSSLAGVGDEIESGLAFVRRRKFSLAIEFMFVPRLLVRLLRGLTSSFETFTDDEFNEEQYEHYLQTTPHLAHAVTRYQVRKLQARFYCGSFDICQSLISQLAATVDPTPIFEVVAEYPFFAALTHSALLTRKPDHERDIRFAALQGYCEHLTAWASRCPVNFTDRACLVKAEVARLEGREIEAERLYEDSIALAREHGFTQHEALANELAGQFYSARGFRAIAGTYLRNARSCYRRWGAEAKVRQLDQLYPQLEEERAIAVAESVKSQFSHLELSSVVQMYQIVSSEIVLDRLIERLMTIVVENAGAVRGLLLLRREAGLHIVAEANAENESVIVKLQDQSELGGKAPDSVLHYVARTLEAVIIDDALIRNSYSEDPYFRLSKTRSVLCLPLVKQKQLVGVLYLENGLASHMFTQDRVSVLQLLSSQAAISIENAYLFLDVQVAQGRARRVSDELKRSFDMIPALAWRASCNGAFEYCNKRWHDYTGIPAAHLGGDAWIRFFHPDDLEKVAEKWRQLSEYRTSGEFEARMRRFDGEYRRFLVRLTPVQDDGGDVVTWHGTNTDIEDLKRAEQAQEALARVSRVTAMGELTVSIAHEVNQPLMAIVTNAATCLRWLNADQLNVGEARAAAERIIRDGHRAGEVITSIRALAKKSLPERIRIEIHELLLEVLLLTRNEFDRHGIVVETDFAPDVTAVLGDRVQLQQVVLNLIMNGIESFDPDRDQAKELKIGTHRDGAGNVEVTVADNGVGLKHLGTEQIFEVFFTTKKDGMGIGLSICRSIIETHSGRLWATANQSSGTTFHFTVPRFQEEQRQ